VVRLGPGGGGQAQGLPDGLRPDGEADGLAERLARLVPDARAVAGRLAEVLGLAAGLDETELVWDGRGAELEAASVGAGVRTPGAVAGLNVATDSIAPATRQTARMLASNGMIAPCPARGPASRRIRLRRRLARCSR
jgi:hypothetical protein